MESSSVLIYFIVFFPKDLLVDLFIILLLFYFNYSMFTFINFFFCFKICFLTYHVKSQLCFCPFFITFSHVDILKYAF